MEQDFGAVRRRSANYVPESIDGVTGQLFSENDLTTFQRSRVAEGFVDLLRHDARLFAVLLSVQVAGATLQQTLLPAMSNLS